MQKPFRTLLFSLTFLLLGTPDMYAQTINVLPSQLYRGQLATLYVTGTNVDFSTASSCRIYQGNPSSGYNNPVNVVNNSELYSSAYISTNAPLGLYDVDIVDFFAAPVVMQNAITIVNPPSGSSQIRGNIRGSTICNFNGTPLANKLIVVNPGGYLTITDGNGDYTAYVPSGTTYNVSVNLGPVDTIYCPTTPSMVNVILSGQTYNAPNVVLGAKNVVDLQPFIHTNIHRPGFNTTNYAVVKNNGAAPASNVEVKIAIPSWMTYFSNSSNATFANDTLTWTLPTLAGQGSAILYFVISTPIPNTLGNNYQFFAEVESGSTDVLPANNLDASFGTVTGSYDPNDKQVWTQGNVNADGPINPSDSVLRYKIRFQNTGTDTAFTVRINDVFDADLDISSLEMINASHAYAMEVINNSEINFLFPNILLPDSNTNEPLSHGFIEFSLKVQPGLPVGTKIDNEANIYFDFNSPILTNTVTSTVCYEASLDFSYLIAGPDVTFNNLSTGTLGSFEWDFGDGNTSIAVTPVHTYAAAGIYQVCLDMTDTCGTRSFCQEVEITTIAGISGSDEWGDSFTLFPNPNAGLFNLQVECPEGGHLQWRVLDLRGKTLHQADEAEVSGVWQRKVDLRDLPVGSYFLQVEMNGRQINRMFHLQ